MAKKEFKIREVFQCGLVKLKCEKYKINGKGISCNDCYFGWECKDVAGECSAGSREDKTDVIFVKVEDIEN